MADGCVGKRLLMLGGYPLMKSAIDKVHELGAYAIVTDWSNDAPAKQWADEFYNVSTTDVDALEQLAREIGIDGVFAGMVDVNLIPCAELCERLGFPCYATAEQFANTLDKAKFKALCKKYGVPIVDTAETGIEVTDYETLPFPVIIKPTDSYSSKGIKVCRTPEEAKRSVEEALEVSPSGHVIIEPFVEGDDVYLYFTVQNGLCSLSAMADRFLNDSRGERGFAPQPMLYMLPSRYIDLYYEQAHDAVQAFITGEGIKNGSFMMQGFVVDGKISFFEMGLRITGGAGYINIRHQNEVDQLEMHLRYALGDGFGPWDLAEKDNPRFAKPACVIVPLLKNGTIAKVAGVDKIKSHPAFVDIMQLRDVGSVMNADGTLNQVFARIYMSAPSDEELLAAIEFVYNTLQVEDADGNSLLFDMVPMDEIKNYIAIRKQ